MKRLTHILGPLLVFSVAIPALAQNATYNPPQSSVGQLQTVGMVGRTDPATWLGRIGGQSTGRFDSLYVPTPRSAADYSYGMYRPRGVLNTQDGAPGYTGSNNRISSNLGYKPRMTYSQSTYENNKMQSYTTRHQLARGAIPNQSVRETGALANWQLVVDRRQRYMLPIERLHMNSNLLRPKSPLGQLVSSHDMAIYDPAPPSTVGPLPARPTDRLMVPPEEEGADLRKFDSARALRLDQKYEEYKASGIAFFKEKNWIKARASFDSCRHLQRDNAWPLVMDALVALETREIERAVNSLTSAVARARTLDDMNVKIEELYGTKLEFEKSLDAANLLASQDQSGQVHLGHVLLSYCAWLNGDLATAASAAQTAAKSMPEETGKDMQRYADQLKELSMNPAGTQK